EASSNVAVAATAAAELSASIGEISEQLVRTTDVVRASVQEAETTNAQIAGLASAAQKIGDVVKLISNLAGQTNLLALNATTGAAQGTHTVVAALDDVAGAATATRSSAETVLSASRSVESAVANLRAEVEAFLGKVAA